MAGQRVSSSKTSDNQETQNEKVRERKIQKSKIEMAPIHEGKGDPDALPLGSFDCLMSLIGTRYRFRLPPFLAFVSVSTFPTSVILCTKFSLASQLHPGIEMFLLIFGASCRA